MEKAKQGLLFTVSGPSGVGKGTMCKKLVDRRDDLRLSVSCTARAPRQGEVDGVHYFFITEEKFDQMAENGEFLEYANVFGRRYGTPRAYVEQMLAEGHDVILEIDVQGGAQVMRGDLDLTSVFVLPPDFDTLVKRLVGRGTEAEEQIRLRLRTSADEILAAKAYDYLLVNDDLDAATDRLEAIITSRHSARDYNMDRLMALYDEVKEEKSYDD